MLAKTLLGDVLLVGNAAWRLAKALRNKSQELLGIPVPELLSAVSLAGFQLSEPFTDRIRRMVH